MPAIPSLSQFPREADTDTVQGHTGKHCVVQEEGGAGPGHFDVVPQEGTGEQNQDRQTEGWPV